MKYVYAYLCTACNHMASGHRLADGGDLRSGPYVCGCGRATTQDGPFIPLSRQGYEKWKREQEMDT